MQDKVVEALRVLNECSAVVGMFVCFDRGEEGSGDFAGWIVSMRPGSEGEFADGMVEFLDGVDIGDEDECDCEEAVDVGLN